MENIKNVAKDILFKFLPNELNPFSYVEGDESFNYKSFTRSESGWSKPAREFAGSSINALAKINIAMHFADLFCLDASDFCFLNFKYDENKMYGEFYSDDMTELYKFVISKDVATNLFVINYENYIPTQPSKAIIPYVAFRVNSDPIIKKELIDLKNEKSTLSAYRFCDALYYMAKAHDDFIKFDNSLVIEEMEQLNENNGLALPECFKGFNLGLPTAFNFNELKSTDGKTENKITFEEIKNGSMLIDYKWSDEVIENIPKLSTLNSFVPTQDFINLLYKIKYRFEKNLGLIKDGINDESVLGKNYINSFLLGKPGTGKTKTVFALGAALGVPVYSVPLSRNTEEDVFQGMNKIVDGKLTFVKTDTIKAFENGGIIVFEEINLADPAVTMGSLGQAIEFPYIIHKNGYEVIKRHPLLAVFGTMNIGTYGSKGINQALSSRFKQSFILNETEKDDMIKILSNIVSVKPHQDVSSDYTFDAKNPREIEPNHIDRVYKAYEDTVQFLKESENEDLLLNISTRSCIGALESLEEGLGVSYAFKIAFAGKVAESDLELAYDVEELLREPDIW